jgi:ketosteroid isomerase-like protein
MMHRRMKGMRPADLIMSLYGDYARRDIDAVMECFGEDAVFHWNADAEPSRYCGSCRGKAAIRGRLLSLAGDFEYLAFRPINLIDSGDRVAAEVEMRLRRTTTGEEYVLRSAHFWIVRDDKVVSLTEYYDTALVASMF